MAQAGLPAIWIREKELDDRELFEIVEAARRRLPAATRVLVSGRPDVARAAGADGVHLASTGLPTAAVAARFGDRLLIGRSTHTLEEVATAARDGADYVTFGPVWATPGKGPATGVDRLRRAVAHGISVVALGGVTTARLREAAAAGAHGAAALRLFADPSRAAAAVAEAARLFGSRQ